MKLIKLNKSTRKRKQTLNPYGKIDWEKASNLFRESKLSAGQKNFPSVKELLPIIAAAGAIGLVFAFPGAAVAIGAIFLNKEGYNDWKSKKILGQLSKQKYITVKDNENDTLTVKITRNGMIRALTYQLDTMELKKPNRWDKKWRLIIFDIPEKYRKVRDIFRMRLKQLGLYQLQKSVYISPYSCFDEIEFLRELYGVAFTVKYLIVERIEEDAELKSHFEL